MKGRLDISNVSVRIGSDADKRIWTDKDIQDFAEWVDITAFRPDLKNWYFIDNVEERTTITKLRELWEKEKKK